MIPKIIHQTWKDNNVPEKWKKSQDEWIRLHPNWEYKLWTDQDIRNHIATYHPDFLELHDNYEYPIQRADMIRYFVLYDYGGVYCDLDLFPTKNIENYIVSDIDHFVYSAGSNTVFDPAFMISPGKSPLMKEIMNELKRSEEPWYAFGKHMKVMFTTGPNFLHNVLLNTKFPFIVMPRKLFYPYSSSDDEMLNESSDVVIEPIKETSGSWHSIDSTIYASVNRYKEFFILFGIMFILFIIICMIYYICKYRKCKQSKKCIA